MGFSSLHVCMDSSDHWLQGTIHEGSGLDSSSSPSGVGGGDPMLTCSRPLIERRLRPPHDQALKCPRCDSTRTKFCYYNNYSLSQPRYFCKTCRRYWTKGGTLRNIPVGGGCRKNKKVSKKSNNINNNDPSQLNNNNIQNHQPLLQPPGITTAYHHLNHDPKDNHHLQLSFPDAQFSHIGNLLGNPSFMLENNPRPIDFMESKLEGIIGSTTSRNNIHFLGNSDNNMGIGIGVGEINGGNNHHPHNGLLPNFQNLCSPSGFGVMSSSFDGNSNVMMDSSSSCQRLMMLPYVSEDPNATIDVKPNPKLLSIEWQDQGCSDAGKDQSSFGYLNGLGSWTGMINGYGSSTTNPLV